MNLRWRFKGLLGYVSGLAVLLTSVGCSRISPSGVLFGDLGAPVVIGRGGVDGRPVLKGRYGAPSGPSSFSALQGLAVSRKGILAVVDVAECRVELYSVTGPTLMPTGQFGKCGDGPGELRQVRSMTFVGDTLAILLAGQPTIRLLALDGREVGRLDLGSRLPAGFDIQQIEGLPPSALLVSLASGRGTGSRSGPGERSLALVYSLAGDSVIRLPGSVPQVAMANTGVYFSGPALCAGTSHDTTYFALANRWASEVAIYRWPQIEMLSHVAAPGDYSPLALPNPNTGYMPRIFGLSAACVYGGVLLWSRTGHFDGAHPVFDGGRVLGVSMSGSPLMDFRYSSADSAMLVIPEGSFQGRLFGASNQLFGYPQIVEFELDTSTSR